MEAKPKVFKDIHYSTDDNGCSLVVDLWAKEARIVCGSKELEISAHVHDLEEWRDMFQAAIDDMAMPSLEAITDRDYINEA